MALLHAYPSISVRDFVSLKTCYCGKRTIKLTGSSHLHVVLKELESFRLNGRFLVAQELPFQPDVVVALMIT